MSFILDALKKSEQKRQRSPVPDVLTVHDPMPQEPKKRSLWPYLLLTALLLNAGILAVWLLPRESENQNVITQSTAEQQHESTAIVSESLPQSDTIAAAPTAKSVNVVPQNRTVKAEADGQKTVPGEKPALMVATKASLEISPDTQEQTPVINHSPTGSQSSANKEIALEQGVFELHELPLSVRQGLPDMSISGHIYSNNPASRMININGQIIREGETLTAGIKVEEITVSGVIFSYQGFRFRMKRF